MQSQQLVGFIPASSVPLPPHISHRALLGDQVTHVHIHTEYRRYTSSHSSYLLALISSTVSPGTPLPPHTTFVIIVPPHTDARPAHTLTQHAPDPPSHFHMHTLTPSHMHTYLQSTYPSSLPSCLPQSPLLLPWQPRSFPSCTVPLTPLPPPHSTCGLCHAGSG